MARSYRVRKAKTQRRTLRGGVDDTPEQIHEQKLKSVEKLVAEADIKVNIINPTSKFVVATYWWGRGNQNKNLQSPCPEEIRDLVKIEVASKKGLQYDFPRHLVEIRKILKNVQAKRDLTDNENAISKMVTQDWELWVNGLMAKPELQQFIKDETERLSKDLAKRTFDEMIVEWESYCKKVGVNYVAVNTELPREMYQYGINAKPIFIKRVLDVLKNTSEYKMESGNSRAVLYIDGDMWMLKYPHIFDIDCVDFMARGWNMDPRSKERGLAKPYYDPYIFETSGGTMYFGNTQTARNLLDEWEAASSPFSQKGKADDRILSMIFTKNTMVLGTNLIDLPIEYLWLTDNYKGYLKDQSNPASLDDAYIEHPYCLTGEERASSQGAAANRMPDGYEEEITDVTEYSRPTELFYEYIFLDGDEKKRDGFARYLKYMQSAKNHWTKQPLMKVVPLSARYGEYDAIAKKNIGLSFEAPAGPKGLGTLRRQGGGAEVVRLELNTPIPEILKHLAKGHDVELGGSVKRGEEDEFVATDASTREDAINEYTRKIRIDTTSPMFLSGKNRVIYHLLAMCETLADINKHINGSYFFMSRIRWNLLKGGSLPTTGVDFVHRVHQIWFGGEMPEWRKKIFDDNKAVCEKYGFEYKLWKNQDRTLENFSEQTLKLHERVLAEGKKTGQNRWAQVADLARLEIVYNGSGIYVDSIIEISPALLVAVVEAIKEGSKKGKDVFVGCNEDRCVPPLDCKNAKGEMYLANSFFAATRENPIFERLLDPDTLGDIDLTDTRLNHATGPYFLRSGITKDDNVIMFDTDQIYMFNLQEKLTRKSTPDPFLIKKPIPGTVKVNPTMYYAPGGIKVLQNEFLEDKGIPTNLPETKKIEEIVKQKGPLAIYHSGLGGTWSLP